MTGWTLDYIYRLPLSRIWAFVRNWQKRPPTHRLLALFLEYKGADSQPNPAAQGFNITPMDVAVISGGRQRQACRQSQLDANTRKRVEAFQNTPAYQEFRKNWRSKVDPRNHGS